MSAAIRERLSRPNMIRHLRARLHAALGLVLTPFFLCLTLEPAAGAQHLTSRVSVSSTGAEQERMSFAVALSGSLPVTGGPGPRFVAFSSASPTMVADPPLPDDGYQVYVHDRVTGETTLVSKDHLGEPAPGGFSGTVVRICSAGRRVLFASGGMLDPNFPDSWGLYVRDRQTGSTQLVSFNPDGTPGPADFRYGDISADGKTVVYELYESESDFWRVYAHDLESGFTELLSVSSNGEPSDRPAGLPAVSENGRYVAFQSRSRNLVPGVDNGYQQIYVRDRQTSETRLASAFGLDLEPANYHCSTPSITTALLPAGSVMVAFDSLATNMGGEPDVWKIFLRDMEVFNPPNPPYFGLTQLVSRGVGGAPANGSSRHPVISTRGHFVIYDSAASNLVVGDTNGRNDVFLWDRVADQTSIVSVSTAGEQGNGNSGYPGLLTGGPGSLAQDFGSNHLAIDHNASTIGFYSRASNLVPNDTNAGAGSVGGDIFVHDRNALIQTIALYCTAQTNSAGCTPHLTTDGSPSASDPAGFTVRAHELIPDRMGIFFFGRNGPTERPFGGGTLCVAPPLVRTPVMLTGSGAGPCAGELEIDLNAYNASLATPNFQGGDVIWGQFWSRDEGFPSPNDTNLTSAVWFTVKP